MVDKVTKAQEDLIQACKMAKFDVVIALEVGLTCKKDEHALKMAEYIRNHPNEDEETYVDKAYEIIGEPRPEYVVED